METNNNPMSLEELVSWLRNAQQNPVEAGWQIYRHLKAYYKEDGSEWSRQLLAEYVKLRLKGPGRLHSCMLQVAGLMCQEFADFGFDSFLRIWGYPQMLLPEDLQPQTGKDGRVFLSLRQRTDRLLLAYMLHHPDARKEVNQAMIDAQEQSRIMPMLAVKVFETERPSTGSGTSLSPGRKPRRMKSAKLIGPKGEELIADSHTLPCKPWEIQGTMFDVLIRKSKEGKERVQEAVVSQQDVVEVFPAVAGYVDAFDADHRHYHVYDALSRHFVAESPRVKLKVGDFVLFSPIIPQVDKFKSAIIHKVFEEQEGTNAFGLLPATITYINREKAYFRYELTAEPPTTPEGVTAREGFAHLDLLAKAGVKEDCLLPLQASLLLFLKRGKEGTKRNHVARVYAPCR